MRPKRKKSWIPHKCWQGCSHTDNTQNYHCCYLPEDKKMRPKREIKLALDKTQSYCCGHTSVFRLLALTLDRNKEILILQKTIKQYPTSFCKTVKGTKGETHVHDENNFFCAQDWPTFSWKLTVKKGERCQSMWAQVGPRGKILHVKHTHACTHARVIIDTTSVTKDKPRPIRLQPWPWSFQLHTRAGLDKPPGFMHCLPCMCPLCNLKLWKHKEWTGTRISNHSKQIQEQFKVQMCYLYQVANFHKNLETKRFFFYYCDVFLLVFFPPASMMFIYNKNVQTYHMRNALFCCCVPTAWEGSNSISSIGCSAIIMIK